MGAGRDIHPSGAAARGPGRAAVVHPNLTRRAHLYQSARRGHRRGQGHVPGRIQVDLAGARDRHGALDQDVRGRPLGSQGYEPPACGLDAGAGHRDGPALGRQGNPAARA